MSTERWLPVVGYEGRYEVSGLGRVRSLWSRFGPRPQRKMLAPKRHRCGYLFLCLRDGSALKGLGIKIHRLVLAAFRGPPPPNQPEVNHINSVRDDNRLANLEYVSRKENMRHSVEAGRIAWGLKNGRAKLSEPDVAAIQRLAGKATQRAIGTAFGVSHTTVGGILRGQARNSDTKRAATVAMSP